MYYVSKKTRVVPDFANERKVQSTLAHISQGWLPPDPSTLQELQKKLRAGYFSENRAELIDYVKEDLALLSQAAKFVRAQVQEPVPLMNPLRDLEFLPDEELEQLFDVAPSAFSKHRMTQATKLRCNILKNAVVAANAAEVFAEAIHRSNPEVESGTAFSSAAFQQLGWNLVAWNYPDLLSSAIRTARKNRAEASAQLRKILGISPEQISAHFASQWLFEPTLKESMNNDTARRPRDPDAFRTPAQIIASVREGAETFAALETGMATRDDEKRWEKQQRELNELAPNANFVSLAKRIRVIVEPRLDRLAHYTSTKRTVAFSRPERISDETRKSFAGNAHLQRCPAEIQEIFRPIYDAISEQRLSLDALQSLVGEAIPAAGFHSGCIFLLHATKAELVPAVKLGDAANNLSPRRRKTMEEAALESFNSNVPVRTQELSPSGDLLEHVCAAFGDADHPGVLLLEVDKKSADRPDFDSTLVFKAVRRCLQDCLGMSSKD